MQGKRYEDVPDAYEPHERMEPGGYRRVNYGSGFGWQWEIVDPTGTIGRLQDHTIEEHEDGTITVAPSIARDPSSGLMHGEGWHGWLERGVWREC
jgi:hypothetical protein